MLHRDGDRDRERDRDRENKNKNENKHSGVLSEHFGLSPLPSLSQSLAFSSSIAPFVQHLFAVQAENTTSCPFEREVSRAGKAREQEKDRKKETEQEGESRRHCLRERRTVWSAGLRITGQQGQYKDERETGDIREDKQC